MKSRTEIKMKLTDLKILLEKEENKEYPDTGLLAVLNCRIETLSWVLL